MRALVIYDSMHGNTEQVARAVAAALQPAFSVRLAKADPADAIDAKGLDLILVGGPTHRHRMSRRLADYFDSLPRRALRGVKVGSFDTRYRMPAWLSGCAAADIARRLRKLGGQPVLPPQSYFVTRDVPPKGSKRRHDREQMEGGELERAAAWAEEILKSISGE